MPSFGTDPHNLMLYIMYVKYNDIELKIFLPKIKYKSFWTFICNRIYAICILKAEDGAFEK